MRILFEIYSTKRELYHFFLQITVFISTWNLNLTLYVFKLQSSVLSCKNIKIHLGNLECFLELSLLYQIIRTNVFSTLLKSLNFMRSPPADKNQFSILVSLNLNFKIAWRRHRFRFKDTKWSFQIGFCFKVPLRTPEVILEFHSNNKSLFSTFFYSPFFHCF